MVVEGGREPLVINDLSLHSLTENHSGAKEFNIGSFIGMPIWLEDGILFGTLCAIDQQPYEFNDYEISLLKTMAELIAHTIKLENIAIRDSLTGYYNRTFIRGYFDYHKKMNNDSLALLFLDLDNFKLVNDIFGHDIGDTVLQEMADRIYSCVGQNDIVARIGGDEFIVLIQGASLEDRDRVNCLAQRILDKIAEPTEVQGMNVKMTGSIGISFYPENGLDMGELLKQADITMYAVKNLGKNGVQFYKEHLNRTSSNRFVLENALHNAIENDELEVHYQPIYHLQSDKLACFEALLRWNHPQLGRIPPMDFIPIAEETGLITRIGDWVLQTVCEQGNVWEKAGFSIPKFSVNLSVKQFEDRGFLGRIEAILKEAQFDPSKILFEITESMLMSDIHFTKHVMRKIQDFGIQFGIDDFGTGYSSLAYLSELPISYLKLDKSFILNLDKEVHNRTIAKSIIALAHSLNIRAIAEGIETQEQKDFLLEQQADFGQGYLLGRPVSASFAEEMLEKEIVLI